MTETRVGSRSRVRILRDEALLWEAEQDGFVRFQGPIHRRRWYLGDDGLVIKDWLLPEAAGFQAEARYYLVNPH